MDKKLKSFLQQLESTRHLYWNISPKTGQFLNLLIKERKYKNVLEIGTSNGYSGLWLAEALKQNHGHLWTIESHKERFTLAKKNFEKSGLSNFITQIPGHAPEVIPKMPRHLDLIFLDATKYEYSIYFKTLQNRLKKGGQIIADNAISHKEDLKEYYKFLKNLPSNWENFILKLGSGLSVSYKN